MNSETAYSASNGVNTVFSDFRERVIYTPRRRNDVNGNNASNGPQTVLWAIVDDANSVNFMSTPATVQSDVLVYVDANSAACGSRACVGGSLQTIDRGKNNMTYRIDDFAQAGYMQNGGHVELRCTEVRA